MNNLAYRTSDENGLSFELVVDGQSLATLIGSRDAEIPYWIIDDDLPYFPPFGKERDQSLRIVTVCSCGEYGCGCALCRLQRIDDFVVLSDFDFDVSSTGSKTVLRFSAENYDEVVGEIVSLAKAFAEKYAPGRRR